MSANNMLGVVLIRENTTLPAGLWVETEAIFPCWRVVRNLDGRELARKIQNANWNFFYLAGVVRTIAFGREKQKTVRRAIREILANLTTKRFNSLEITGIVAKRFLGIPFVSVTAHSRHIQESSCLAPVEGRTSGMNAAALQEPSVDSRQIPRHGQVLPKHDAAAVQRS